MEKPIWISFDLGARGNYEGLYTWLDKGRSSAGAVLLSSTMTLRTI